MTLHPPSRRFREAAAVALFGLLVDLGMAFDLGEIRARGVDQVLAHITAAGSSAAAARCRWQNGLPHVLPPR